MRYLKVGVATVIVLAACAVGAYAFQIVRFGGHVPMPASDASAEQVVRSYIDALNEHDCTTAVALWINPSTPSLWCDNISHITATIAGQSSETNPATQRDVSVDVSVKWRLFHDDGSLPPKFSWTFLIKRSAAGWRIYDDGQG